MSEDRRDKELQQELKRLGEPEADNAEIAAAERLAARLEGALHVVDGDDDVSTLAQTLKATGMDPHADAKAGDAATDRALSSIFAEDSASESTSEADAPADELEQRRAGALAAGVDRMIAGMLPGDVPSDVRDLLHVTALIRAAAHATPLSSRRLETLVEQAYGAEAPAAPATEPKQARGATLLRLALVAVLSVVVLGAGLMVGGYLGRRPEVASGGQLPTHLTSRSTRDILPGAFPREQTAGQRIDLIYHDRMRSFRELHLGGAQSPHRAGRTP